MRERKSRRAASAVALGVSMLIAAAGCSLRQARQATPSGISRAEKVPAAPAKEESAAPAATFVANPFCKACHVDFDEEPLALTHRAAGIGCERCHGESLRHRSDEANVTPPDIMYPKERINPTCMMCHPRQTIQQVDSHKAILRANLSALETLLPSGNDAESCTDCHGREHRLKVHAVEWDKCTGTVLP
jgi:hypothetical protein